MDDLVKRLRVFPTNEDGFIGIEKTCEEAASRIEQLEEALDDVATHLPRAEWHYLKDETLITIGEKKDG
jgi:hypothetical protein